MGWLNINGNWIGRHSGKSWSSYWATREPSNASATATGATTVTVTWDDPADVTADGIKIYVDGVENQMVAYGTETANITELIADTAYTIEVKSYKGTNSSTGVSDTVTTTIASPASVATLAYWYDLTDYTTMTDDGAGVISQVLDKVASLAATGATTDRPTYQTNQINGKGCLTYNGTSNTLAHTAQNFGTAWTIFIVWKAKMLNGVLVANGTTDYFAVNGDYLNFTAGGYGGAGAYKFYIDSTGTKWSYDCFTHGTTLKAYERKNRTPFRSNTIPANTPLRITNVGRATNLFFGGQVAEIIVYSSELSDSNRLKVSSYIEAKFNLPSIDQSPTSRLSFLGNSMTASSLGNMGGMSTYPPELLAAVITAKGACNYFEWAVSGWTTAQLTPYAPFISDNYTANPKSKNDIVLVWEGTNDLATNKNATDAYTRLAAMTTPLKTAGVKVGILTILPRTVSGYANFNADRLTVNQAIRDNIATIGDFVVDVGDDALMGQDGDQNNTTYYADTTHPKAAGYTRLINEWILPAVLTNWTD